MEKLTWNLVKSLVCIVYNLFECRKCVTLIKQFPLDSLAELWAIVIRRVVLRMVGWSQSSHPWTFIASIFCEAQLKDPPNTWIRNRACLFGSHQLTMESWNPMPTISLHGAYPRPYKQELQATSQTVVFNVPKTSPKVDILTLY